MRKIQGYLFLLACLTTGWIAAQELVSSAPENADVYFIEPTDGAQVASTFTIKFGLRGMGIAPAGVNVENTGHHHLLVDFDGELDMTQPLPASDQVRHFGKGQTETEITLPAGEHRLQLVLGNYLHIPHEPAVMSYVITVMVK